MNLIYIKPSYRANYKHHSTISSALLDSKKEKKSETYLENDNNSKIKNLFDKVFNLDTACNISSMAFSIFKTINKRKKLNRNFKNPEIPEREKIQSENTRLDNSQRKNDSCNIETVNSEILCKKEK